MGSANQIQETSPIALIQEHHIGNGAYRFTFTALSSETRFRLVRWDEDGSGTQNIYLDHISLYEIRDTSYNDTMFLATGNGYRYAFNGMERDDEWNGVGNSYDFGARIYDSRLGRWLARDPSEYKYPSFSSFCFSLNSPILFLDPDGKDPREGGEIIDVTIDRFEVTDVEDHREFGSRKLDKELFTKAFARYAALEKSIQIITRGSEAMKQAILLLNPDLKARFEKYDKFMNAAHDDQYNLFELIHSADDKLGQPSTVVRRKVENLGIGFESEVTEKRVYALEYNDDGEKVGQRLISITTYELKNNPAAGTMSDEVLKSKGLETTEKYYEIKTNNYEYNEDGSVAQIKSEPIKTAEATPRESNADPKPDKK